MLVSKAWMTATELFVFTVVEAERTGNRIIILGASMLNDFLCVNTC